MRIDREKSALHKHCEIKTQYEDIIIVLHQNLEFTLIYFSQIKVGTFVWKIARSTKTGTTFVWKIAGSGTP